VPIPPSPPGVARRASLFALLALAPGCASVADRRMQADHDSYQALALRRPEVPEVAGSLDVDRAEREADPLRSLTEVDLDLAEAYRLAALASREYRNRREDAYLAALAYTGARHKFESQFALGLITGLQREPGVTTATATPTGSVNRAFEAGGSFALKLATDFLQTFGNDPLGTARDLFTADLLIPIGRGAGTLVARENLTQAERDVVYALRAFARYQQELAVSVTSGFYRVLESRDTLENEEASYKSLELVHERAKMFGAGGAGRQPDFAVDQARQNVLLADERRTRARLDFEQALDDYKRELGIPTRVRMTVHEGALEALRQRGLVAPAIDLPRAVDAGLARRLDLANARDQADDAVRKAAVAQDALGAGVDLRLGASLLGAPDRPIDVRGATASGSVGLGFDLPIERTAERNAWRAAQIQADRAQRSLEGLEDQVTADVRTAWRTILAAEKSFQIQQEGVRVAERRVESAKLSLQAGKAEIRDVLDAELALVSAKNGLTAALVSHAVARLDLDRDSGLLDPVALLLAAGTGTVPGAGERYESEKGAASPTAPLPAASPAATSPAPPPPTPPVTAAPAEPTAPAAIPAGPAVPAPDLPAK